MLQHNPVSAEGISLLLPSSFTSTGEDEYGIKGGIEPRFHRNADCRNAYKNYFCWINFPRCDEYGQSLMTCRSSCENFFRMCGYERDLWRCGESKYFNGYAPEVSSKSASRLNLQTTPGKQNVKGVNLQ
jgi:hypothetical protein